MKNLRIGILGLIITSFCFAGFKSGPQKTECTCNKDSMQVVMRFEIKVKPDKVAFFQQSFDECKAAVLAQEPGCLDYSLFQSYSDSTLFCLTEAWANKTAHNEHMKLEHTKKHIAETRDIKDRSFKSETSYVYWICPCANKKE
jgi:quinol monooxygenase YgiN